MEISEELLSAWLRLTANVRGNRILNELSLNEIMILRLLRLEGGETGLTATILTERMKLLKSQTHKVLLELEGKGYIERRRDGRDARAIRIAITDAGARAYLREHSQIMELVDRIVDTLGEDDSKKLVELVDRALTASRAGREDY